jgi:hypothetical protein
VEIHPGLLTFFYLHQLHFSGLCRTSADILFILEAVSGSEDSAIDTNYQCDIGY